VSIHSSRNEFFPVQAPDQKMLWHSLVDPNMMLVFQSGRHAQVRHGRVPPSPAMAHPHPLSIPSWASHHTLIGYTGQTGVSLHPNRPVFEQLHFHSFPSVYYTKGHATMDHTRPGNPGWKYGNDWTLLFFGNVPENFIVG
jgi:hypothetical protein